MKNLLSFLAASTLVVGSSQGQSLPVFQGDQHWVPWPANLDAPGRFGRAVAADFTPDGVPDVLQLDGSQLVLLANPDEFFAASVVALGVTDLDVLPGAGASGLDAAAVVGPLGLDRVWYDPLLDLFSLASIDASSWAGALLVRAADLNDDGASDLIGVSSDGQGVLVQLADSSGTTFTAGTGFSAQASVRDLLVLQWDEDSAPEVAVLTDLAVEVYDLDGTLLDTFQGATPGGAICKIGQASTTRERLVWITEYAPPALQFLLVLAPGGVTDLVDLGALDAFAVVPSDYDLDGDDDILISHKFSYELLWIENERSPQNPNGSSFEQAGDQKVFQVEDPGPAPQNEAWPVVADLDGDGDLDVFFASEGSSTLTVFRGETLQQDDLRVSIDGGDYDVDFLGNPGELELTLGAPASLPAGATHLELRVWRQAALGGTFDHDALEVQTIPLPGSWPHTLSVTLPETDASFADNYHLHLRVVELDGGGALKAAYPSTLGAFVLLAADRAALESEQPAGASINVPIPPPLEPEQAPGVIRRKQTRVPKPPGSANSILNFG